MLPQTLPFEIVLCNFAISNLRNAISKSRKLGCAISKLLKIGCIISELVCNFTFLICAAQFRNCINLQIARNIYTRKKNNRHTSLCRYSEFHAFWQSSGNYRLYKTANRFMLTRVWPHACVVSQGVK